MQRPEDLSRALDYQFAEPRHLEHALTHRSAGSRNNERLEFLGDAILGLVVAEELYQRFPRATEGELSRLRATLVKRETLAEIARGLDLGEYLTLGPGELKSGGFRRDSILADALEAVFGALYLDGGFARCGDVIRQLFADRLEGLPSAAVLKDPKTRLQEYLQSRRLDLPDYQVVEVNGQAHAQNFRVECHVAAVGRRTLGEGSSRRRAEQESADRMLKELDAE